MIEGLLKRSGSWLPTVLVLLVVLVAGSRLVILSLERHADDARAQARTAVLVESGAVELQLRDLATRAINSRPQVSSEKTAGKPVGSGEFRIDANGTVVAAQDVDQSLTSEIATEWASARSARGTGVMGAIRHGSQWILVARVPLVASDGAAAGWSVAWSELEQLLARARMGRLVAGGYDFTFSEVELATGRARPFGNSGPTRLTDPERATVRLPAGFSLLSSGAKFELALKPSDGWYPASRLATEIGLLALLTWLVAFGMHDLLHRSQHLKAQLDESKQRQAALGEKLETEIEGRLDLQKSFDHARYHDAFTGCPTGAFSWTSSIGRCAKCARGVVTVWPSP